jgi:predicted TIM-barrel fold metal-dependent hydrolase
MRIIDASAHPHMAASDDIRNYMKEPIRRQRFPNPDRYYYPAPQSDYADQTWPPAGGAPASDPALLAEHLFGDMGIESAVLLPLTRGIMPDVDTGTAICNATNDWLADVWLGRSGLEDRFWGTIRVNPGDPAEAVKEIQRWQGNPKFVQVAVPLEAHKPYGNRYYFPIWEAAAAAGLPVTLHADGGTGAELFPSPVGYFHHYIEYVSFLPYNGFYHLVSLIAEGVLDRLPELRVVFADGMGDIVQTLLWRMDAIWKATRDRTPWVRRPPESYMAKQVRFIAHSMEGPTDPAETARYWSTASVSQLQMYASNYPHWDLRQPPASVPGVTDTDLERFLAGNAVEFYRLGQEVAAGPAPV